MNLFMRILLLSLFFVLTSGNLFAQSFSEGLELYRAERFEEAAQIFADSNEERANLYAGKSYLSLMQYAHAIHHLDQALQSPVSSVRHEALYTASLAHFALENYDVSLTHLHELTRSDNRTGLRREARRFYEQIMNYLSLRERFETLYRLSSPEIRFDLVRSSHTFMDYDSYRIMVRELAELTGDSSSVQQLPSGSVSMDPFEYPDAPRGTVYNVGVLLPTFSEEDPRFTIPRNLYYGMVMAAQDFNSRNVDQKVNLLFRNSAENPDTVAEKFSELIWTTKIDAAIGPLFSEPAFRMAQLAEEYQSPMLAPLANSDSLNLDYNYTFQINPTFEVHGAEMARFAVNELGLDTLAVIADEKTLGRSSALAFRHEAERLGAHISYYIERDFASTGYDFSEITDVFTPDPVLIDSLNFTPSDAIYAPFTGQASGTMMNLLMNNLEAMGRSITLLGSEEWERASLTETQKRLFNIYYSYVFRKSRELTTQNQFEQDYQNRFGADPDRFSMIGYDTADFLFRRLLASGNPEYLSKAIREEGEYEGLIFQIQFNGKRVNQNVFIRRLAE